MKKHNFTLVEILGVVALIVILMVISAGVYTYASNSAKEKATQATITRVYNALQLLQDKGMLKVTKSGSEVKYSTLTVDAGNTKLSFDSNSNSMDSKAYKLFIKAVDGESLNSILDDQNRICDAWGQPLYICFPGKFNKGGIDIISAGGDGGFGECADSSLNDNNGKAKEIKYKDDDGDLICDDISNFF